MSYDFIFDNKTAYLGCQKLLINQYIKHLPYFYCQFVYQSHPQDIKLLAPSNASFCNQIGFSIKFCFVQGISVTDHRQI